MNQWARNLKNQAKQPQNEQNREQRPQHHERITPVTAKDVIPMLLLVLLEVLVPGSMPGSPDHGQEQALPPIWAS
jgi:hypothetical protein